MAENLRYSKVLQGLLSPSPKMDVAVIDLPPNLNAFSPAQPTMVLAAVPAVAAARPPERPIVPVAVSPAAVMLTVPVSEKTGNVILTSKTVALGDVPAQAVMVAGPAVRAAAMSVPRKGHAVLAVVHRARFMFPSIQTLAPQRKIYTIGQPVKVLNASGIKDRVGMVTRRLSILGWTVRQSDARQGSNDDDAVLSRTECFRGKSHTADAAVSCSIWCRTACLLCSS